MRLCLTVLAALLCAAGPTKAQSVDLSKIDRSIREEPAYKTKAPQYALLVFGPQGKDRVWLVRDGDTLYVDRNGNGDLTEAGEKVAAEKRPGLDPERDGYSFDAGDVTIGGRTHCGLRVVFVPLNLYPDTPYGERPDVKATLAKDRKAMIVAVNLDVLVPSVGPGGRRTHFVAGPFDLNGLLQFADRPATAPVVHLGGPLQITFYQERPRLRAGAETSFVLAVGTPGSGPGTFAVVSHEGTIPEAAKPVAEVLIPGRRPEDTTLILQSAITDRCCGVRLYGPIRVPENAGTKDATVTLSFDSWKGANVKPTTHTFAILPQPGQVPHGARPKVFRGQMPDGATAPPAARPPVYRGNSPLESGNARQMPPDASRDEGPVRPAKEGTPPVKRGQVPDAAGPFPGTMERPTPKPTPSRPVFRGQMPDDSRTPGVIENPTANATRVFRGQH